MVGLATKEVEDDTLAFNEIFAKRLEETRDERYEENCDCEKRKKRTKRRREKMGIGDGSKFKSCDPPNTKNQPLFPV